MGDVQAFFPYNISTELNKFIIDSMDNFYYQFVEFWSNHKRIKPCGEVQLNENNCCSTCMIVDGHMKIRRRICANSAVSLILPERFDHIFDDVVIGCGHSPSVKSCLCYSCKENGIQLMNRKKRSIARKKEKARRRRRNSNEDIDKNSMSEVRIYFCIQDID